MRSRHQGAENIGMGNSDSSLRVNAERVLRRIDELARIARPRKAVSPGSASALPTGMRSVTWLTRHAGQDSS